ncbi:hypothetical protein ACLI4U_19015 (plasmid) [Natrialbaceae archaeon A-CW2]
MSFHKDPRERLDAIQDKLDHDRTDPEIRAELEPKLSDAYAEYVALRSEKAFEQHMAKHITEAYNSRQRGERETPLCSCSQPTCNLTNGELPAKLRYSSSVFDKPSGRKRALEYIHRHRGSEILHEVLESWDAREGELHQMIAKIHNQLNAHHAESFQEIPQHRPVEATANE